MMDYAIIIRRGRKSGPSIGRGAVHDFWEIRRGVRVKLAFVGR